jgi:hypothetical protein
MMLRKTPSYINEHENQFIRAAFALEHRMIQLSYIQAKAYMGTT